MSQKLLEFIEHMVGEGEREKEEEEERILYNEQ